MNVFILFLYSFEFFIISYSFEYLCEVLQKVHDARLVRYMPFKKEMICLCQIIWIKLVCLFIIDMGKVL